MKLSRRAKRMEKQHRRHGKSVGLNMVSMMDIFTILVFFLLVSSQDAEVLPTPKIVKLPESSAEARPKENIVITVNNQLILLQGKAIADTTKLDMKESVIPVLMTALQKLEADSLTRHEEKPASSRGVTIMGDQEIPYELLKKIMLSCATVRFSNISLAVVQKSGEG